MEEEEIKPVDTLTPEQAGKIVHKNAEWIRARLRQGNCYWGDSTQITPGQWNYLIIKDKFLEFATKQETNKLEEILVELKKINKVAI